MPHQNTKPDNIQKVLLVRSIFKGSQRWYSRQNDAAFPWNKGY